MAHDYKVQSRWSSIGLTALIAIVTGLAGLWAGAMLLVPGEAPLAEKDFITATVVEGEVASTFEFNATATWQPEDVGTNQAAGIVTEVLHQQGDLRNSGDILYAVDLRPVTLSQGATPAFRSIAQGARGADVKQLQQMLQDLDFFAGEVDGVAGPGTVSAVMAWQRSLEVETTGVVGVGDVIFVPELPARITLDTRTIHRGASLAGGEVIVQALPSMPTFSLPLTEAQARNIQSGMSVSITHPHGEWDATVGAKRTDTESNLVHIELLGIDDSPVCGEDCADLTQEGENSFLAKISLVDPVSGLVVPSTAIMTDSNGAFVVIDESGTRHTVDVITTAKGLSVVEGVSQGTQVRVPAHQTTGSSDG